MKKNGLGGLAEEVIKEEPLIGDVEFQDSNLNEIKAMKGPVGQMRLIGQEKKEEVRKEEVKKEEPKIPKMRYEQDANPQQTITEEPIKNVEQYIKTSSMRS